MTAAARPLDGEWWGEDLGFVEGPVLTADGALLLTSISRGEVWQFTQEGQGRHLLDVEGGANGLTMDAQGQLYGTHIWHTHPVPESKKSTGGIVTWESGAMKFVSRDLISPNDLCFGPDGFLYATDPTRDRSNWDDGRLFRLDPSGEHPAHLLFSVPWFPNGIGFNPVDGTMLMADSGGARLLTYDLEDGVPRNERMFASVDGGVPDGFAFDTEGNVLVCCPVIDGSDNPSTLQVFSPAGELLDKSVPNPESTHTTNVALGPDGSLYITDADRGSVLCIRDWPGAPGVPLYAGGSERVLPQSLGDCVSS